MANSTKRGADIDISACTIACILKCSASSMKPIIFFLTLGVFGITQAAESFTLVVLPDTQNYLKYPKGDQMFQAQVDWIRDQRSSENIVFVCHEGDVTDNNSKAQWTRAREIMSSLDGVVPYAICVGNHDIAYEGPLQSPLLDYFCIADFEKQPGWGGQMQGQNCFWHTFSAGGLDFLVLSLDFGPSDEMLAWADSILDAHPNRKAILLTHEFLGDEGVLSDPKSSKNARFYGSHHDGKARNCGQEIWDKHVRKHPQYFLTLNGHYKGPAARNSMRGDRGNTVHQLMANYQYTANGGNGYLRVLKFLPEAQRIEVRTYSPHLKATLDDEANSFDLDFPSSVN